MARKGPIARGIRNDDDWVGKIIGSVIVVAVVCAVIIAGDILYFTIAPMRHLGIRDGLIAALKADTISLTAFEVGMFGWMALNRHVFLATPPEANTATFWFLMQIAMIVGFATSYPANWWLLKSGLKESM